MSSTAEKKAKKKPRAASAAAKTKKPPKTKKAPAAKQLQKTKEKKVTVKKTPKSKAKPPAKKEPVPKTVTKKAPVKLGPPPSATIISRYADSTQERRGRGFSFGELESAGVPLIDARNNKLSVDVRRRSVLNSNVESLKAWFATKPEHSER